MNQRDQVSSNRKVFLAPLKKFVFHAFVLILDVGYFSYYNLNHLGHLRGHLQENQNSVQNVEGLFQTKFRVTAFFPQRGMAIEEIHARHSRLLYR